MCYSSSILLGIYSKETVQICANTHVPKYSSVLCLLLGRTSKEINAPKQDNIYKRYCIIVGRKQWWSTHLETQKPWSGKNLPECKLVFPRSIPFPSFPPLPIFCTPAKQGHLLFVPRTDPVYFLASLTLLMPFTLSEDLSLISEVSHVEDSVL